MQIRTFWKHDRKSACMESMLALIKHTHENAGPVEAKLHWSGVAGNLIAQKYYWGRVCLTLFTLLLAWYWWSVDTNKGILKAASLFECHLNIDSVLLESEGANQSLVPAKHSLTNTQQVWLTNPSLASSVVLECMQVLAKFETKVWQNYSLTIKSNMQMASCMT